MIHIPKQLQKIYEIFHNAGYEFYIVGGAVRDILLGKQCSDWDAATNASPIQVMKLFKKVIPTGIAHGTVTILFLDLQIEVTTYRIESTYSDSRHPDSVHYTQDLTQDLSRRDFTINAMALDIPTKKIIDPFDGTKDLKKKILKTVGNPRDRFNEDGLRVIRAIRFASQLNFTIEENTLNAIPHCLKKTKTISIERFRDEFIKILLTPKPSVALKLLEKNNILSFFIPELATCRGISQQDSRGYHIFDVFDHSIYACDHSTNDLYLRLAALFHDIGKAQTRSEEIIGTATAVHFYNHEKVSAHLCNSLLKRLRFPIKTCMYVSHLVLHHMFHYEPNWTDAALRRFLVRIQPPVQDFTLKETLNRLFDLRIADVGGMKNTDPLLHKGSWSENLQEFKTRLEKVLAEPQILTVHDLKITGKLIMDLGVPQGKAIGMLMNRLLETVIADPQLNTQDKLLEITKNMIAQ